jgi:hypothetical protein
MTLSSAVRHGRSEAFWNAMPTKLSGRSTTWLATFTLPAVAGQSPVTTFIKVDFPQPEGPTTATNSPCGTVKLVL